MNWFTTFIVYLGSLDAAIVMTGGIVTAALILFGVKADVMYERIWPAIGALIGSSVAATVILGCIRWLVG